MEGWIMMMQLFYLYYIHFYSKIDLKEHKTDR